MSRKWVSQKYLSYSPASDASFAVGLENRKETQLLFIDAYQPLLNGIEREPLLFSFYLITVFPTQSYYALIF